MIYYKWGFINKNGKKMTKKDYELLESKFDEWEQDIYKHKELMESLKALADT
ncbi:hypothetical protein [Spiroplasma sp. ChiS]|uniref:hypothetical protein n=1 Tax=Spiroplasma sp. ChiS TaxID=2099885 RepID=UPI0013923B22|nr:hypothetical protein [Spiroplasma sp. ChiS]